MNACLIRILSLVVLFVGGFGCDRKPADQKEDTRRYQTGVGPTDAADRKYLPLKIVTVHEKQQALEKAPWRRDGGDWTFFECELAHDANAKLVIGVRKKSDPTGEIPVAWGEAIVATNDAVAGKKFVEAFAKAFHQELPDSHGDKPIGFVKANTALFGSNLGRDEEEGGFGGKGTWTATKWFLEGEEAEVFFNYSIEEKRAEFSEKDEAYREALTEQFAIGLRDGPLPERTPENDPSLTLSGPRVDEWIRFAHPHVSLKFLSDNQSVVISEAQEKGSRISLMSLNSPAEKKPVAELEGEVSIHQLVQTSDGPALFVSELFRKDPTSFSTEDPELLWIVSTAGKRPIEIPKELKKWNVAEHSISPDGKFLALHRWKEKRKNQNFQMIHLGDLTSGKWVEVELPGVSIGIAGWANGRGIILTGTEYGEDEERKPHELDPVSGQLSPLEKIPNEFHPTKKHSPDGRFFFEVKEGESFEIHETPGNNARTFQFHAYDKRNVFPESLKWIGSDYLLFQGKRPALISVATLKMNFPCEDLKMEQLEFSPDFRFAVGRKEDGAYLGRVVFEASR